MLTGAGVMKAIDERSYGPVDEANGNNVVEGLLQSSTYVSGLSGGSWLLGSLYMNNFSTIHDLQKRTDIWDFWTSILFPNDPIGYWGGLIQDINRKTKAKFDVSFTDLWGRALSVMFIGLPKGGPSLEWTDMREWDWFKNHEAPMPIVVANGRTPGQLQLGLNTSLIEMTPWELGSFDPTLYAMTRLENTGTELKNSLPKNASNCARGFDNAGLVFGTSIVYLINWLLKLLMVEGP